MILLLHLWYYFFLSLYNVENEKNRVSCNLNYFFVISLDIVVVIFGRDFRKHLSKCF